MAPVWRAGSADRLHRLRELRRAIRVDAPLDDHQHPLRLSGKPPSSELPPYVHVLFEVLTGGSTLSVRGDEAEEAWRVVTPVLEACGDARVPLEEYPAGSAGPPALTGTATGSD